MQGKQDGYCGRRVMLRDGWETTIRISNAAMITSKSWDDIEKEFWWQCYCAKKLMDREMEGWKQRMAPGE